jgi:hypothetical protein
VALDVDHLSRLKAPERSVPGAMFDRGHRSSCWGPVGFISPPVTGHLSGQVLRDDPGPITRRTATFAVGVPHTGRITDPLADLDSRDKRRSLPSDSGICPMAPAAQMTRSVVLAKSKHHFDRATDRATQSRRMGTLPDIADWDAKDCRRWSTKFQDQT